MHNLYAFDDMQKIPCSSSIPYLPLVVCVPKIVFMDKLFNGDRYRQQGGQQGIYLYNA